jgi:hypothetical protein
LGRRLRAIEYRSRDTLRRHFVFGSSVPGFLIIPAGKSNARFVGHRPGTEVRWQANRHLWFQADYGIFYAGKFVKESQPGRNLNYWALWAGYKF